MRLSRLGPNAVTIAFEGRVDRFEPSEAAELESRGATTIVFAIHQRSSPIRAWLDALACAFDVPGSRRHAAAFLGRSAPQSGLGAHQDGRQHILMVQLEGEREITLWRPIDRGDPRRGVRECDAPAADATCHGCSSAPEWRFICRLGRPIRADVGGRSLSVLVRGRSTRGGRFESASRIGRSLGRKPIRGAPVRIPALFGETSTEVSGPTVEGPRASPPNTSELGSPTACRARVPAG